MSIVLGIDLGTTNSCMAVMDGGDPKILNNIEGMRTTPSVVAFTEDDGRLVGDAAKRQAAVNPENTIYSIKRFMGRKFKEVTKKAEMVPYEVVKAPNEGVAVKVKDKGKTRIFTPPEISAMILGKLKRDAEELLGETISQAVITVPAYFDDSQRQATMDAGIIAGLDVMRIINEPTAASLAYGLDQKKHEQIVVYDLGGGTFDISVLKIEGGVFEVKAYNGDNHLGGDDWDNRIVRWVTEDFQKIHNIDLSHQPSAIQRIKVEAEKAKIDLSSSHEYELSIPFIASDDKGPKNIQMKLSRSKLEDLSEDLFERTREPITTCLKDAEISTHGVNELLLVGGMTRMPKVIETARTLINKNPHQGINPDVVVAIGAAIQGDVLKGNVKDLKLVDITPLSLGTEIIGGIFVKIIDRFTTIPTCETDVFTTVSDNQSMIRFKVLQGERKMGSDNRLIGKFILEDIPLAPRGVPEVEVTFKIDENNILHVSAVELKSKNATRIAIKNHSGLNKKQIERMRKEAEENAIMDKKRLEEAKERNKAGDWIYKVEKLIKNNPEWIIDGNRPTLEERIEDVKNIMESDDVQTLKASIERLQKAYHSAIGEQ